MRISPEPPGMDTPPVDPRAPTLDKDRGGDRRRLWDLPRFSGANPRPVGGYVRWELSCPASLPLGPKDLLLHRPLRRPSTLGDSQTSPLPLCQTRMGQERPGHGAPAGRGNGPTHPSVTGLKSKSSTVGMGRLSPGFDVRTPKRMVVVGVVCGGIFPLVRSVSMNPPLCLHGALLLSSVFPEYSPVFVL